MVIDLGRATQEVSAVGAVAFTAVLLALGGVAAALIGALAMHLATLAATLAAILTHTGEAAASGRGYLDELVSRLGFEPRTRGLKVPCSDR